MAEVGLLDHWRKEYQSDGGPCFNTVDRQNSKNEAPLTRITIKNLSGAFVLLLGGISFSITVFIGELILFHCIFNRKKSGK